MPAAPSSPPPPSLPFAHRLPPASLQHTQGRATAARLLDAAVGHGAGGRRQRPRGRRPPRTMRAAAAAAPATDLKVRRDRRQHLSRTRSHRRCRGRCQWRLVPWRQASMWRPQRRRCPHRASLAATRWRQVAASPRFGHPRSRRRARRRCHAAIGKRSRGGCGEWRTTTGGLRWAGGAGRKEGALRLDGSRGEGGGMKCDAAL